MIPTTRQINVNLEKGGKKLVRVSTKDVDASIKAKPPKKSVKTIALTTSMLDDVADIVARKEREAILKQRRSFKKGDPVYLDEKGNLVVSKKEEEIEVDVISHPTKIEDKDMESEITTSTQELVTKPWNKMNSKERKEYQAMKAKEKKEKK